MKFKPSLLKSVAVNKKEAHNDATNDWTKEEKAPAKEEN